jgi:hypothetical protein
MKCRCCDKPLSNFESTRKIVYPDEKVEYVDLCNYCYYSTDLQEIATVVERYDLMHEIDVKPEETYNELNCNEERTMSYLCEEWEGQC